MIYKTTTKDVISSLHATYNEAFCDILYSRIARDIFALPDGVISGRLNDREWLGARLTENAWERLGTPGKDWVARPRDCGTTGRRDYETTRLRDYETTGRRDDETTGRRDDGTMGRWDYETTGLRDCETARLQKKRGHRPQYPVVPKSRSPEKNTVVLRHSQSFSAVRGCAWQCVAAWRQKGAECYTRQKCRRWVVLRRTSH